MLSVSQLALNVGLRPLVGSNGFSPQSISGLAQWLDAADASTITSSAGAVSQWNDKSGNGRHVSQSTESKKPVTGTATLNGRNAIRFDGTDDILQCPSFWYDLGGMTVFVAFKGGAQTDQDRLICESSNLTNNLQYGIYESNLNTTGLRMLLRNAAFVNELDAVVSDQIFTSNNRIICVTDSGSAYNAYVDGDTVGPTAYTRGANTFTTYSVGGTGASGGATARFTQVDIGEIIIYNRVLTSTERQQVVDYLESRWYEEIDVVLLLGQSNADGRASVGSMPSTLTTFYGTTRSSLNIYYKPAVSAGNGQVTAGTLADDGAWWTLHSGHDGANTKTHQTIGYSASTVATQSAGLFGPEVAYGYQHYQTYGTARKLFMMKAAVGGSGIEEDWGITAPTAGLNWDYFKTYIYGPAYADIQYLGYKKNLYVIWMQGETDADNNMSQATYEGYLQTLITRLNTELFKKPNRIVLGGLSDMYDTYKGRKIKLAQKAIAAANSNTVLMPTDGTGSLTEYPKLSDDIHYDHTVQYQFGIDLFNTAKNGISYTMPFMVSDLYNSIKAWWDSADAKKLFSDTARTTLATSTVGAIADKSGYSKHFTQATGASQPVMNGATINGLTNLSFDGTDDYMSQTDFIYDLGGTHVFLVLKADNQADNARILAEASTSSINPQYSICSDFPSTVTDWSVFIRDDASVTRLSATQAAGLFNNNLNVIEFVDSGTQIDQYINGVLILSSPYTRAATTPTTLALGALVRTTIGFYANFKFCEGVVYSYGLTSGDRANVTASLIDKWS